MYSRRVGKEAYYGKNCFGSIRMDTSGGVLQVSSNIWATVKAKQAASAC